MRLKSSVSEHYKQSNGAINDADDSICSKRIGKGQEEEFNTEEVFLCSRNFLLFWGILQILNIQSFNNASGKMAP